MHNILSSKQHKKVFLLLTPLMLLSACAGSTQVEKPIDVVAANEDAKKIGWHQVGFEITWPENQEPAWYMDTLIAHSIVAPVLERYRWDIRLWRFHRRAAHDTAGHRFSFIFYTSAVTAARINAAIKTQPQLQELLAEEKLVKVDYEDPQHNPQPNIENTSDSHWPLMVQKTWPSFIMGASEMWLGLIREIAAEVQKDEKFDDDTLYPEVQKRLSNYWREEGQHPFLHHLNALFGYEEMLIIDRKGKAMRF